MTSVETVDRIAATKEPDAPVVMRQNWHHLLFLHWEVPPAELQLLVPPELTIDTFEGKAYVGLIPFTMTGVRPVLTPPLPWISNFHEVNVRTYVHRKSRDPGVWFFSLDASSAIAVAAARAAYKLPYFHSHIEFLASNASVPKSILLPIATIRGEHCRRICEFDIAPWKESSPTPAPAPSSTF